jgi:hypothetical protein
MCAVYRAAFKAAVGKYIAPRLQNIWTEAIQPPL